MTENILKEHRKLYAHELETNIIPFWVRNAPDRKFGGYFTCFHNDGVELVSTDKYVWSQGRLVWVFSEMARMYQDENYLTYAELGANFLLEHAQLPNGNCAFLLTREGKPKETQKGEGFDTSIYADCFVVLGLAKYAAVAREKNALEYAFALYKSVATRVDNVFRTEPYPIPAGYKAHGVFMILLNTGQELRDSFLTLSDARYSMVNQMCKNYLDEIIGNFYNKNDSVLQEMVNPEKEADISLLGRYINPGHSLESLWFIMHQVITDKRRGLFETSADIIEQTYRAGWDEEYGGLLLFVDKRGGQPRGQIAGYANHRMVEKLTRDWSHKLWWVQVEALYSTLLNYHLTKRKEIWELYSKTKDYIFETFPNPNKVVGEWIQIRDRKGSPLEKVVALPVKDPFHIARSLMLLIQLINKMLGNDLHPE